MILTSSTIVSMCSKLAALSSNQAGLTTSDFLNIANLVMPALTGELLAAREEYLIYQDTIAVAAGQSQVRIPYRALNGTIRHLWWQDATGARAKLDTNAIEDIEGYNSGEVGSPGGFYLLGNNVVLLPTPVAAGSLVVAYPFRPNQLVDQTACQQITAIAGNVVTLASMPSGFTTGASYDFVDHLSGNGIVGYDLTGTVAGNTVSFAALPSTLAVGNWISLAGTACCVMLPEEGHGLLLEQTVMRLEMIRGNQARVKSSQALVVDARRSWDSLLLNRVVSKARPAGSGGAQSPSRPV